MPLTASQQTLKAPVQLHGVGLHSGALVTLTILPAAVGQGILFRRRDVSDRDNQIPARWDHVVDTRLCTVIGNAAGVTVGTIEHLMAALRGCDIDNAVVELDGPEVPIMDGSALPFVVALDAVGVATQNAGRRAVKILRQVSVTEQGKTVVLRPAERAVFGGSIDFTHAAIGQQTSEIVLENGNFRHALADARTFGFMHDVEALRRAGLALGGSLENAVVLDADRVLNEEGLRSADEFIRHKLLDAIGDLYLAGAPIVGAYEGDKGGHALNNAVLRKLFATPAAWEWTEMPAKVAVSASEAVISRSN